MQSHFFHSSVKETDKQDSKPAISFPLGYPKKTLDHIKKMQVAQFSLRQERLAYESQLKPAHVHERECLEKQKQLEKSVRQMLASEHEHLEDADYDILETDYYKITTALSWMQKELIDQEMITQLATLERERLEKQIDRLLKADSHSWYINRAKFIDLPGSDATARQPFVKICDELLGLIQFEFKLPSESKINFYDGNLICWLPRFPYCSKPISKKQSQSLSEGLSDDPKIQARHPLAQPNISLDDILGAPQAFLNLKDSEYACTDALRFFYALKCKINESPQANIYGKSVRDYIEVEIPYETCLEATHKLKQHQSEVALEGGEKNPLMARPKK